MEDQKQHLSLKEIAPNPPEPLAVVQRRLEAIDDITDEGGKSVSAYKQGNIAPITILYVTMQSYSSTTRQIRLMI